MTKKYEKSVVNAPLAKGEFGPLIEFIGKKCYFPTFFLHFGKGVTGN
jgi:hypothetical protein